MSDTPLITVTPTAPQTTEGRDDDRARNKQAGDQNTRTPKQVKRA